MQLSGTVRYSVEDLDKAVSLARDSHCHHEASRRLDDGLDMMNWAHVYLSKIL